MLRYAFCGHFSNVCQATFDSSVLLLIGKIISTDVCPKLSFLLLEKGKNIEITCKYVSSDCCLKDIVIFKNG